MSIKVIILIFLTSFFSYAQESSYKIVAVGQAGQAKQGIIVSYETCKSNNQLDNNLQAIAEITRNDFSFYKSFLNVNLINLNPTLPAPNKVGEITKLAADFWIHWRCNKNIFEVAAYNIRENKEVLSREWRNGYEVNRALAHQINDLIYQSYFQKQSIFNSKIVFSGAVEWGVRKSVKEIYTVDFDGHNLNKVTNHRGLALSPAFSPDNQKIIYSLIDSTRRIKNVSLYELDLQTGKSRIVSDKAGMNSGAIYSADGKGLYMTLSYKGNADIYYLDLATSQERSITKSFAEDVDPSVTRDGSLLTFLSNRAGKANVYTLDPRILEKDIKRISFVGKFNATPRFAPDGSEIIFSSWVDSGFDLFRLSLSGQSLVRLTKNFGSNEDPTFSLDGQFVVFTSRQSKKGTNVLDQKIYIMNRDGEILGALTQNFKICSSPRLSN